MKKSQRGLSDLADSFLQGQAYAASHQQSVNAICGADAPKVFSQGTRFFNRDNWTARVFQSEMCKWAKKNPNCIPTLEDVRNWCKVANNLVIPPHYRAIFIAHTPRKLRPDRAAALTGGAYHEAFHTKYSCRRQLNAQEMYRLVIKIWSLVQDWSKYHGLLQEWNNIIEDIRIERRGCEQFPGVRPKLVNLQEFILDQEEHDRRLHLYPLGKIPDMMSVLICSFRDLGLGYTSSKCVAAINQYKKWSPDAIDILKNTELRDYLEEAKKLSITDDLSCIRLALQIIAFFVNQIPQEELEKQPCQNNGNGSPDSGESQGCPKCKHKPMKLHLKANSDKGILTCPKCGYQEEVDLQESTGSGSGNSSQTIEVEIERDPSDDKGDKGEQQDQGNQSGSDQKQNQQSSSKGQDQGQEERGQEESSDQGSSSGESSDSDSTQNDSGSSSGSSDPQNEGEESSQGSSGSKQDQDQKDGGTGSDENSSQNGVGLDQNEQDQNGNEGEGSESSASDSDGQDQEGNKSQDGQDGQDESSEEGSEESEGIDSSDKDQDQKGSDSDQKGSDSDQEGSDSDQEGSDSDQEGSDSDQKGSDSDQEGSDSDQEGSDSDQKGSDSDQEGSDSDQKGSDSDQEGSDSDQKGSDSDQEGSDSDQKGSDSDQEGSDSDQKGSDSDQEGSDSDQEGSDSDQKGSDSDQKGSNGADLNEGTPEDPSDYSDSGDPEDPSSGGFSDVTDPDDGKLTEEQIDQLQQGLDEYGENGTEALLDVSKALEEALREEFRQEYGELLEGEKPYAPYCIADDSVQFVKPSKNGKESDKKKAERLYKSVLKQATFLRTQLRRLVLAAEQSHQLHGVEVGEDLSEPYLVDTVVSLRSGVRPRSAFYTEGEDFDPSIAASIVIDQSYSMKPLLRDATRIMMAIAEPLDQVGAAVQSTGFRNSGYHATRSGDREMWNTEEDPDIYHRNKPIWTDVFQAFGERYKDISWRYANTRAIGGTPMADGIQVGLMALRNRPEGHRLLIVISDGCPDEDHLPVINWQLRMAKESGIHVIGVGMGIYATYVQELFPDHVWAETIEDLPKLLIKKLTQLLDFTARGRGKGYKGAHKIIR